MILTIFIFKSWTAHAQNAQVETFSPSHESSSETPVLTFPSSAVPGNTGRADFSGTLRIEGTQYLTSISDGSSLNQFQSLQGSFRYDKRNGRRAVVDAIVGDNLSAGASHWGVSEAFVGSEFQEPSAAVGSHRYAVGRKLEDWSQADRHWQLGQWQPTFGQLDVLRPVDQGLTGFFYEMNEGPQSLLLFGSPIFIPSMGPDVKEKNGSIESDSRWYKTPSPRFLLQGVPTSIVYSVDIPDLAKLAAKPALAARYRFGESKGLWTSLSAGHKPINALLLKYNTVLRIPVGNTRSEVTVAPSVGYHDILGADMGYSSESGNVSLSLMADKPSEMYADSGWIQQQPEPFQVVALHSDREFTVPILYQPLRLSLDYLRLFGGKIHDIDAQNEDAGALFASRFNYSNAASIKLETQHMLFRKNLVSSIKYLREFDQKGSLVSTELNLFVARGWAVTVGFDVLGVDNEDGSDSFLNQFRANDRYYGGMSYVF